MREIGPFRWDEAKRAANKAKHGVDFAEAEFFEFDSAMVLPDDRKNYGEIRFRAFGLIKGRLHALVFTHRAGAVRIISLRRANSREMKRYAATQKTR